MDEEGAQTVTDLKDITTYVIPALLLVGGYLLNAWKDRQSLREKDAIRIRQESKDDERDAKAELDKIYNRARDIERAKQEDMQRDIDRLAADAARCRESEQRLWEELNYFKTRFQFLLIWAQTQEKPFQPPPGWNDEAATKSSLHAAIPASPPGPDPGPAPRENQGRRKAGGL